MNKREVSFGDPVERLVVHRSKGSIWLPGTVCHVNETEIGIADARGLRHMLPRRSTKWRKQREET